MVIRIVIMLIIMFLICSCSFIDSEKQQKELKALIEKRFKEVVQKKCIEGHEYYYISGPHEGGLAPVLTDDGKPVKCEEGL